MGMSRRENEIKLAFASPDLAIRKLHDGGAREVHPRAFEDNVLYDVADRALARSGRLLRLRRYGAATILTFKAPVPGEHRHKVRVEHETAVADPDAMRRILEGLGFAPVYRYQKYRTGFLAGGVAASVDETPLGTFVELEGSPDEVDRVARALGCDESRYVLLTYRELQEREAAARGVPAGDLLMPGGDESR
jgi:adenylate cyclase class 2